MRVFFCVRCKAGSAHPGEGASSALYATASYRDSEGRRFRAGIEWFVETAARARARRIIRGRKQGAVLDVGCGRGLLLRLMKQRGWDVTGAELNEETARYGRERHGLRVVTEAELGGLPAASYDVISIIHVLEHVDDPGALIARCRRLLKPEGFLMAAVPNLSSLQARAGGRRWFHLDPPYHLTHFTEEGLTAFLLRQGLRSSPARHFDLEQGPFGWLQTLLNMAGIRRNALYELLKRPELGGRIALKDKALSALLAPILFPVALALSLFESFALRQGGAIEVVATPEAQR